MSALRRAVERRWYARTPGWLWLLWPLAWLFARLAARRRRRIRPWRAPVPVLVVGNIAVGGTGKTPVVVALAALLTQWGYRPGIVSRGYGGSARAPQPVDADSDPRECGDEPLLLAQSCACPVWVGRDRPAAVRALLATTDCDLVIADDGLQHYALGRDLEVVVVDGDRGLGNGRLLPMGPLREASARLAEVDWVLINGGAWSLPGGLRFELSPYAWVNLHDGSQYALEEGPRGTVHGVAGIGHPQRFFRTLRGLGLDVVEHPFPDHWDYRAVDLDYPEQLSIVTTAKDAVKLSRLAPTLAHRPLWYLAVRAQLPAQFQKEFREKFQELREQSRE